MSDTIKALVKSAVEPLRDYPSLFLLLRRVASPSASVYQHLHFRGTINIYALAAGAANPLARVLALEPIPRVFELLKANLASNKFNIVAEPVAASNFDGDGTIFETDAEFLYSASLEERMALSRSEQVTETKVRCRQIDHLLKDINFPRLDLIKIDVEMHEPHVLEGMRRTLQKDRPTMIVEVLLDEMGSAIEQLIGHLGYQYSLIDDATGAIERSASLRGGGWPHRVNYLIERHDA